MFKPLLATIALTATLTAFAAVAEDYTLTLKDHAFTPATLEVPAQKKFTLTVKNLDASAAEFESHDLHREKVVAANGTVTVKVGPLKPGSYGFFDDFHRDTATGTLVAK
jgi:hypothetical protein